MHLLGGLVATSITLLTATYALSTADQTAISTSVGSQSLRSVKTVEKVDELASREEERGNLLTAIDDFINPKLSSSSHKEQRRREPKSSTIICSTAKFSERKCLSSGDKMAWKSADSPPPRRRQEDCGEVLGHCRRVRSLSS
ncbi:hypothetical protein PC116_g18365 [Phytophthora cactorum]|uniref:Uncharacterized protein n=1 Tax=Phytophthora cactorum TaxID=29920 RepID=A0A8T1CQC5_9STRA|nr:hypothetical protein Pcac1_g11484 [Phytophthora cactorum]KAG2925955.1 hypothetical protein PC117_g15033 [Phytophthora cactorum]KAG3000951.1 hypothetical protein PC120_g20568 [Phytophthora cactorum]KAG3005491.1 hypothetical protein PC119_g15287 [Phytophthora cactorum]KAG3176919.1 hypothetical protein C6341_g8705 [Phytophthora cactorum]